MFLAKTSPGPLLRIAVAIHRRSMSKLYEPEYLESMKSKIPLYDTINVQLKGHDYPVLENYQKYLHSLLKNMDVNVEDSWAAPAHDMRVLRYKPKSDVLDSEFKYKVYERNIQIVDISATQYPTILRILEASLPEGVSMDVHEHTEFDEEIRYVPDKELIQLKTQLDDMTISKKK